MPRQRVENKEPFLRKIAENPYDDAPRLVFADWLDEHDDPEWAEFIRLQIELEPKRDRYELPGVTEMHKREEELLRKRYRSWLGSVFQGKDDWHSSDNECNLLGEQWGLGVRIEFRRGFPDILTVLTTTFLTHGAVIRQQCATLRRVELYKVNDHGAELALCPALEGLAELELGGWYPDVDAEAIAVSPHLRSLQVLQLWLGRRYPMADGRLCRIMGSSNAWPTLRELTLLNPNDEREGIRKRNVTYSNKAAGRKIAVYKRGWPEWYPFAAEYYYLFPGYLPDGTTVLANEDHTTSPPCLCVLTFDKHGKQTKKILRVPLPDEVLAIPVEAWYEHKDKMVAALREKLGFEPGFIRITGCQFPGDSSYDRPWWAVYSFQGDDALFGTTNESPYSDDPRGFAWDMAQRIRSQEYVLGWDRIADKRGWVHST